MTHTVSFASFSARTAGGLFVAAALLLGAAPPAGAHCDTLDGPVVKDAKAALDAREITPVLKWVHREDEPALREAFAHALEVRALGPGARTLADRFFYETTVRLHRAGEGAPFEGLKPAGAAVAPGIAAADAALETGSADALVQLVSTRVAQGLRERLQRTIEAKAHAAESPEKGRAFVAAYVDFIHFAERLDAAAGGATPAHEETAEGSAHPH